MMVRQNHGPAIGRGNAARKLKREPADGFAIRWLAQTRWVCLRLLTFPLGLPSA